MRMEMREVGTHSMVVLKKAGRKDRREGRWMTLQQWIWELGVLFFAACFFLFLSFSLLLFSLMKPPCASDERGVLPPLSFTLSSTDLNSHYQRPSIACVKALFTLSFFLSLSSSLLFSPFAPFRSCHGNCPSVARGRRWPGIPFCHLMNHCTPQGVLVTWMFNVFSFEHHIGWVSEWKKERKKESYAFIQGNIRLILMQTRDERPIGFIEETFKLPWWISWSTLTHIRQKLTFAPTGFL